MALTPIRRVVTGNDERGRSKVIWDGLSPGTHEANFNGRRHTDYPWKDPKDLIPIAVHQVRSFLRAHRPA